MSARGGGRGRSGTRAETTQDVSGGAIVPPRVGREIRGVAGGDGDAREVRRVLEKVRELERVRHGDGNVAPRSVVGGGATRDGLVGRRESQPEGAMICDGARAA